MSEAGWRALPPDELLAHAEFVRRLAGSLLRDVHLAEDVAQDTFMAALTQAAPRHVPLPAWLAGIARNRARMEARSAVRRERRERAVPASSPVPTPDELVSRLEVGKRLVDAVLALNEPYRATVFLRFFEDVTPTEIGRRTGIPVDTVKTRLRRALAMLRDRLDRDQPGDRAAWSAALVPVLHHPPGLPGPALVGGITVAAKSKVVIVAVALVGILAGAIGRDLLRDTGKDTSGPPPEDPTAARRSASTAAITEPGKSGVRRVAEQAAPVRGDALVMDLSVIAAPAGEGRVRGHVRTAKGGPIEGAVVVASRPDDPGFGFPGVVADRDLKEWARATVEAEVRRRSRQRTATTAADGAYEVVGVENVPWRLMASHPAYDIASAGATDGRWVRAGETVDFVGAPVARVQVDVVGPANAVIDEATLAVRDSAGGDPRRLPWTPGDPVIRLREGSWSIEAFARNGEMAAPAASFEIRSPSDTPHVVLRLGERLGVRGRVLNAPVEALGAVFVHLLPFTDGLAAPAALPRLIRDGKRVTAFGVMDFRYRFDDVTPGRYLLGASNMAGAILASREVIVGMTSVWQDLDVPAPDDASFVTVRVTGPDGSPVRDIDVQLAVGEWVPPAGMPSADVVRGGDGTFRIRRSPSSGQREGAARIVARSKSLGRKDVPFDASAAMPVEVRFDAPTSLGVTVTGSVALSRGRFALILRPAHGGAAAQWLAPGDGESRGLDASGRAEFASLQAGEYDLLLSVEEEGGREIRRIATDRVTLRAGANQATVTAPMLSSLIVEVEGAGVGTAVGLKAMPGGPSVQPESRPLDRDGRAVFELLPPGRYHLSCTVDGRLCVGTAEVPLQNVVQLRPVESGR